MALAILVATVLMVRARTAFPVCMSILLILVAPMFVSARILMVAAAQAAKEILADPAALVVLMSPLAKVDVTAVLIEVVAAAEVVLVALARVFVGTLFLMILAAELVLNVQVASVGRKKLMFLDSEYPPISHFMWC